MIGSMNKIQKNHYKSNIRSNLQLIKIFKIRKYFKLILNITQYVLIIKKGNLDN